ncbi:MAG TPA: sulfite reductase subunit alpha [Chthoniobacteraceae bacterium]|jgi:sulfite reductase (NADPH) flavoprotein alpha-component|nr:sulfite reductase subunit alpha [Chthoniobacteraceae bacterium]
MTELTMTPMPTAPASVPFIPDNAPFTPAQRAWLNGYLAGLFSSQAGAPSAPAAAPVKIKVSVLFGSETGNAEALAKRVAKAAGRRGFEAKALGLDKISAKHLAQETYVLIITSTFGEGDPPENAKAFHEALHADYQPRLEGLRYSVLALGDKNYEQFCKCGIDFDTRLQALGAERLYERVDCDVDYEQPFDAWLKGVFTVLDASAKSAPAAPAQPALTSGGPVESAPAPGPAGGVAVALAPAPVAFSKKNPFPAKLLTNRKLTADHSAKETRHFEISLAGSGLVYEAGDALGVIPTNCAGVVDDLLRALNRDGEEAVPTPEGGESSLRTALLRHYDITKIPPQLLKWFAEHTPDATLRDLLIPEAKEALKHYLYGREIVDLLVDFPSVTFTPAEFVAHLRKLNPRLYSISSSLKAFPDQVHLTVASVRYESFGRKRKGVCSTFLADRVNSTVPVFVQTSHGFRLPASGDTPIIMVGPGTGIAPFRAFLHDRRASGATGRNWLFFGDQRAETDFLYREELEPMVNDGHLSKLSTAFSRDQAEKVYVQNRMAEQGAELWAWLQDGAHFYVCGDASRMAKDVDAALHAVAATHGGLGAEGAAEFVGKLKKEKRYQRDVY